ncbi:FtsX-like permease family protein [Sediminivirga luteola]|uniref:FtsX-like permease family protein n=1 Tax=Sediminivirga luteola TaxID=1774748 RepID=UPI001F58B106|nr:FtsX-like permease family protein [Sediminivirga luteola]MCI2264553.1 hypothetical protein [Sediminivirga luteola]
MSARAVLPLLINRRSLSQRTSVLTVIAYAVPTAIILTVAGGAWAFFRWTPDRFPGTEDLSGMYQVLAVFASILLLIPAANLGAAAAKLSARRNDLRLSTLSLLGASPGTVRAVALAEPLLLAGVGILAGVLGYLAMLLPFSRIHFQNEPLGYTAMLLPWWALLAGIAVMAVLSLVSAALGLRRVSVSPLGVRMRQQAQRAGVLRVVIGGVLLAGACAVAVGLNVVPLGAGVAIGVALGVVAAGLLILGLIGGWIVQLSGRIAAKAATRPQDLMAARIVCDVPKQCWQRVSGLAMTAFAAVFLGAGVAIISEANAEAMNPAEAALMVDIRTGLLLTVGIAFLLIGATAVINQNVDILDRAEVYRGLHAVGMDDAALTRLSIRTVTIPVAASIVFGVFFALVLALPLVGMALVFAPLSMLACALVCVLGTLLLWLAVRLSGRAVLGVADVARTV